MTLIVKILGAVLVGLVMGVVKGVIGAELRKLDREQVLRAQGIDPTEPAPPVRERRRRQPFVARDVAVALDLEAHHRRRARQIRRRLENLYSKARARREAGAAPDRRDPTPRT